jgi:hypothetical protein
MVRIHLQQNRGIVKIVKVYGNRSMRVYMGGVIEGIDINVTTGKNFTKRKMQMVVVIVLDYQVMVILAIPITEIHVAVPQVLAKENVDLDMRVGNGWKQTIIMVMSCLPYIVLVKNFTFFLREIN